MLSNDGPPLLPCGPPEGRTSAAAAPPAGLWPQQDAAFLWVDMVASKRLRRVGVSNWSRSPLAAKQRQNLSRPSPSWSFAVSAHPAAFLRSACLRNSLAHACLHSPRPGPPRAQVSRGTKQARPTSFLRQKGHFPPLRLDSRFSIDPSAPRSKQYLHHFLPFPACSV